MTPIISVVGKSDSGKTSLLEGLIEDLRQRGYRVAVIKHAAEEVELDTAHKDTWRFTQAGSVASAIVSAGRLAVFRKLEQEVDPQELALFIGADCDLILTEGFKTSHHPKIEVHRREQGPELLSPLQELLAVVTDEPLPVRVPQFGKEEVPLITELLIEKVLGTNRQGKVDLSVNGVQVPLDGVAQDLLLRTLMAMVSGMKGTGEIESLQVAVRRKT